MVGVFKASSRCRSPIWPKDIAPTSSEEQMETKMASRCQSLDRPQTSHQASARGPPAKKGMESSMGPKRQQLLMAMPSDRLGPLLL